ncbi:hypothetical protein OQA88_13377 [Cercophora sp. LCS_1]
MGQDSQPTPYVPYSAAYRHLQRLNRDRLARAVDYINLEYAKNQDPSTWKIIEVDSLLQCYRRAEDELRADLTTLSALSLPNEEHTILFTPTHERLIPAKSDVETLRDVSISVDRIFYLLGSLQLWKRVGMAVVAGISVLLPMIIMLLAFPRRTIAGIVTVCISTMLFAVFVAWTSNSTHQDLMGVVATYAAVLVVFVGVSTNP